MSRRSKRSLRRGPQRAHAAPELGEDAPGADITQVGGARPAAPRARRCPDAGIPCVSGESRPRDNVVVAPPRIETGPANPPWRMRFVRERSLKARLLSPRTIALVVRFPPESTSPIAWRRSPRRSLDSRWLVMTAWRSLVARSHHGSIDGQSVTMHRHRDRGLAAGHGPASGDEPGPRRRPGRDLL
jgi:hypothetical protein